MGQIDTRSAAEFYLRGAELGTNQAFRQQDQALQVLRHGLDERQFGQREREIGLNEAYRQEQIGIQQRNYALQLQKAEQEQAAREAETEGLYSTIKDIMGQERKFRAQTLGAQHRGAGADAGPGGRNAVPGVPGFGGRDIGVYQPPEEAADPDDAAWENRLDMARMAKSPEALKVMLQHGQTKLQRAALLRDLEYLREDVRHGEGVVGVEDPNWQELLNLEIKMENPDNVAKMLHDRMQERQQQEQLRAAGAVAGLNPAESAAAGETGIRQIVVDRAQQGQKPDARMTEYFRAALAKQYPNHDPKILEGVAEMMAAGKPVDRPEVAISGQERRNADWKNSPEVVLAGRDVQIAENALEQAKEELKEAETAFKTMADSSILPSVLKPYQERAEVARKNVKVVREAHTKAMQVEKAAISAVLGGGADPAQPAGGASPGLPPGAAPGSAAPHQPDPAQVQQAAAELVAQFVTAHGRNPTREEFKALLGGGQ